MPAAPSRELARRDEHMAAAVSNAAAVQGIYEAFGRGDVPTILAALADDVDWETWDDNSAQKAGVPWMQARKGRDAVVGFFEIIGSWTPSRFEVVALMEGGNKVAAEVEAGFTLPNGASFAEQELHLWTFNGEGKVSSFRHYLDTAKHMGLAKG
jgi:ketosteroid isomerase-like protein